VCLFWFKKTEGLHCVRRSHVPTSKYNSCTGRSSENICGSNWGASKKGNTGWNLILPPKLVEKLVWVPVISFCKIFIPSYVFDALLYRNWPFWPPNRVTFRTRNFSVFFFFFFFSFFFFFFFLFGALVLVSDSSSSLSLWCHCFSCISFCGFSSSLSFFIEHDKKCLSISRNS